MKDIPDPWGRRYGPSIQDAYRRAAAFVDKVFKGPNLADLCIEQPTKFELVVNLKTAKALGLTLPPSVLVRADDAIEHRDDSAALMSTTPGCAEKGGREMNRLEHNLEALRAISAFAELPLARLKLVALAAEVVRFGAGDVIVHQGDPGDAVYALTEGMTEVWLMDAPQGPALLRTMGPGHLFGETAVLYQGLRSATIRAKTAVTTLRLAGPVFLDLMRSSPELAVQVAVILAQRLASDRRTLTVESTASTP